MAEISWIFTILSAIFVALAVVVALDKRKDVLGALIVIIALAGATLSYSMAVHTANCKGYQTESGITLEVCYPE